MLALRVKTVEDGKGGAGYTIREEEFEGVKLGGGRDGERDRERDGEDVADGDVAGGGVLEISDGATGTVGALDDRA